MKVSGLRKILKSTLFSTSNLLFQDYVSLPPSDESEESATEEPKINFSHVECLLYVFHQLAKKCPGYLADETNAERLKDFRVR